MSEAKTQVDTMFSASSESSESGTVAVGAQLDSTTATTNRPPRHTVRARRTETKRKHGAVNRLPDAAETTVSCEQKATPSSTLQHLSIGTDDDGKNVTDKGLTIAPSATANQETKTTAQTAAATEAFDPRDPDLLINAADKDWLVCTICTLVAVDVPPTPCGHTFCRACLQRHVRKTPSCPMCREPIPTVDEEKESGTWKRMVAPARMRCGHESCATTFDIGSGSFAFPPATVKSVASVNQRPTHEFTDALGGVHQFTLPMHYKDCKAHRLTCSDCNKTLPWSAMAKHVASECKERKTCCPMCRETLTTAQLAAHVDQAAKLARDQPRLRLRCPRFVYCPQACESSVDRKQLAIVHRDVVAAHTVIGCSNRQWECSRCNAHIDKRQGRQHALQVHGEPDNVKLLQPIQRPPGTQFTDEDVVVQCVYSTVCTRAVAGNVAIGQPIAECKICGVLCRTCIVQCCSHDKASHHSGTRNVKGVCGCKQVGSCRRGSTALSAVAPVKSHTVQQIPFLLSLLLAADSIDVS